MVTMKMENFKLIVRYDRKKETVEFPKPELIECEDSKQLLQCTLNRVIPSAEWLPEYDKVAEWLTNNQRKGLMLYGSNGRGKSLLSLRVLPLVLQYWFLIRFTKQIINDRWIRLIKDNDGSKRPILISNLWNKLTPDQIKMLFSVFDECVDIVEKATRGEIDSVCQSISIPDIKDLIIDPFYEDYMGDKEWNLMTNKAPGGKYVIVDDVGTEPDEFLIFGTRHRLFPEAVDYCEKNGILLIFSTNLTPDEIKERYGMRVLDRLHALVKPVCFMGDSLRK